MPFHALRSSCLLSVSIALCGTIFLNPTATFAQGVSRDWVGGGATDDWFDTANWSPSGPPDSADFLSISSGDVVGSNSSQVLISEGGRISLNGTADVTFGQFLSVGRTGEGTLDMISGSLTTNTTVIGFEENAFGTASITGPFTTWDIDSTPGSNLGVGEQGDGRLFITDGATVNVAGSSFVGTSQTGIGVIDISGGFSSLTTVGGNTIIGSSGNGTLNITNGASVSNNLLSIGSNSGAVGKVTLDSAGTLTNTIGMQIGLFGTGTLEIHGGGTTTSNSFADVGVGTEGVGHVLVNGTNSLWDVDSWLRIGSEGTADMEISNGSRVESLTGAIGFNSLGNGQVTVRGIGSIWDTSSSLEVARLGNGTLLIAEGASVENTTGDIGAQSGSTGIVTLEGLGSSWTNSSSLDIGDGGTGTLNINSGANVVNTAATIGTLSTGVGTVNINGGGTSWTSSDTVRVGVAGNGALNITGGGSANAMGVTTDVIVADDNASVGSLSVSGAGSTLDVGNDLKIGDNDGGTATATIETGGVVNVTGTTSLGTNGTLNLDGGMLTTTSFTKGSGTLNHNRGTMVIDGGAFNPVFSYSLNGSGGTATLNLQGGGSSNIDFLHVGTTGDAVLNLRSGHLLTLTEGNLGASGELVLDGGQLLVETFNDFSGGTFTFKSGTLTINGDVFGTSSTMTLPSAGVLNGSGSVEAEFYGQAGSTISVTGSKFMLGNPFSYLGFVHEGTLNLGANDAELDAAGFAQLGVLTTLAGGTLEADNGVALGLGDNLTGFGTVNSPIAAGLGSTISASGNLSLGKSTSPIGFSSQGILNVGGNTVTINDLNAADLGALTILSAGGTLDVANGAVIDFADNVTGEGTIQSPNDPTKPIINNGSIVGDGPANQITLSGYIKGVGTCDNCNITGTDAPGFSPASVSRGSVSYNGTLEIELGGTTPGSSFDQLNHILGAGVADLGGTLDVQLIDGFLPAAGDSFDIITATNILGTFDTINLPALPGDLMWFVNQTATSFELVSTYGADFDEDGDVDDNDLLAWTGGFSSSPAVHMTGDANSSMTANGFDFLAWQRQFGSGGVAPAIAATATPEPSSLVLATTAGLLFGYRRRRS